MYYTSMKSCAQKIFPDLWLLFLLTPKFTSVFIEDYLPVRATHKEKVPRYSLAEIQNIVVTIVIHQAMN